MEAVRVKIDKAIEVVRQRIPSLSAHSDMQKAAQAVLNLEIAKVQCTGLKLDAGLKLDEEKDKDLAFLLGRVRSNLGATELQQVTQAVLHLMTAKVTASEQFTAKRTKTNT